MELFDLFIRQIIIFLKQTIVAVDEVIEVALSFTEGLKALFLQFFSLYLDSKTAVHQRMWLSLRHLR